MTPLNWEKLGGGGGGALQERKGVSCYVAPALITGDL